MSVNPKRQSGTTLFGISRGDTIEEAITKLGEFIEQHSGNPRLGNAVLRATNLLATLNETVDERQPDDSVEEAFGGAWPPLALCARRTHVSQDVLVVGSEVTEDDSGGTWSGKQTTRNAGAYV